jgi:hypothetical protein
MPFWSRRFCLTWTHGNNFTGQFIADTSLSYRTCLLNLVASSAVLAVQLYVNFKAVTAACMKMTAFCNVAPWTGRSLPMFQRHVTNRSHDRCIYHPWNISKFLPDYTAHHTRRQLAIFSTTLYFCRDFYFLYKLTPSKQFVALRVIALVQNKHWPFSSKTSLLSQKQRKSKHSHSHTHTPWHYSPDGHKPPLIRFHSLILVYLRSRWLTCCHNTFSNQPDSTTRTIW